MVLDERDDVPDERIIESIVLETVEPVAAPLPTPSPAPVARDSAPAADHRRRHRYGRRHR